MNRTETSESFLEAIIANSLVTESRFVPGEPKDYDREHSVDWKQLIGFLTTKQPRVVEQLGIENEGSSRTQFLHRL